MSNAIIAPYSITIALTSGAFLPFFYTVPKVPPDELVMAIRRQEGMTWTIIAESQIKSAEIQAIYIQPYDNTVAKYHTEIVKEQARYWRKQNEILRKGDEWMGDND
jgi:hypothetical protein